MKKLVILSVLFSLVISPQLSFAQTEKQVIIKGTQTTMSRELLDEVGFSLHDLFYDIDENADQSDWNTKNVHDFTVYYTSDKMRMDVVNSRYKADYYSGASELPMELIEVIKARIVFYFGGMGGELIMELFIEGEDGNMNRIAQAKAPKEGSFTISDKLLGLVQGGGDSGAPWNGHPTVAYSFEGETDVKEKNENDSIAKILREDKSYLRLAKGVDGTDVMDAFYNKVVEGGYDLGGSDEASLLSMIGYFLDEGMPIEIKEQMTLKIEKKQSEGNIALTVGESDTSVTITSVETSEVPIASPEASGQKNSEKTAVEDNKKDPAGCDCSCEKYKELMDLSNKKKKDIDPAKMPQIDMSCIQKCAMEWSKCQQN